MLNTKLKKTIETGENIFLTGQAGTGKSFQIGEVIKKYSDKKKIALTSSTGIAAANINGQTLHSYLNLGMIRTNDIQKEVSRIIYNPYAKWEQVRNTDILIIDEISMIDGFTFSLVDEVLRNARKTNTPFGGVQLIIVGDLLQLPPVESEKKGFFFDSKSYINNNFEKVELTKIYRQNDKTFINCLNRIRLAEHTNKDIEYLKKREFPELNYALLDTTCLYPTNFEADKLNNYRLNHIEEKELIFNSRDKNLSNKDVWGKHFYDSLKADKVLRCPKELKLKPGARVILLSNLKVNEGLCNGSIGHFVKQKGSQLIIKFGEKTEYIDRKKFEIYEKGEAVFTREQYPLALGWAVSVHKSQGMSLDSVAIDCQRMFAPHQVYVALSRSRSYEGLYLKNLSSDKIFVDKKVIDFLLDS